MKKVKTKLGTIEIYPGWKNAGEPKEKKCECLDIEGDNSYCPVHWPTGDNNWRESTEDKIITRFREEFPSLYKSFSSYTGGGYVTCGEEVIDFLSSAVKEAYENGRKEEEERWINQPANEHDKRIREEERKFIGKIKREAYQQGYNEGQSKGMKGMQGKIDQIKKKATTYNQIIKIKKIEINNLQQQLFELSNKDTNKKP